MKTSRPFLYSLLFYSAFLVHLVYAEQKPSTPVGNWEYRRGDSPFDDNLLNSVWRHINKPSEIPIIPGKKDLWIRLHLENHNTGNSAIFSQRIEKIFEVYIDTNRIYAYGKFTSGEKIPMMGTAWHLIKLPANANGKTLYFRIRSVRFNHKPNFNNNLIFAAISKSNS